MAQCAFCKAETKLYKQGVPICVACDAKRSSVQEILAKQLQEATLRATACRDAFAAAISIPSGAQRIFNASHGLSLARKEMERAHNRLNAFLISGIVPEDLKGTEERRPAASQQSALEDLKRTG